MSNSSLPGSRAGVDQRSGIDIAFGQHAIKRRVDVLKRFQFLSR